MKDYTEEEKKKIVKGQSNCPNCESFWLRDYPYPVRTCPACGTLKPWADSELVEDVEECTCGYVDGFRMTVYCMKHKNDKNIKRTGYKPPYKKEDVINNEKS